MHTVTILTDFSEASLDAVRYSIQLYQYQPSRFILLHASHENPEDSQAILDALTAEVQEDFNFPGHTFSNQLIIEESVAKATAAFVKESKTHVVVIGRRGKNIERAAVFGSVAQSILLTCPCPVLAIPPKHGYQTVKKLCLTTDYKMMNDMESFGYLLGLQQNCRAELEVLHVSTAKQGVNMEQTMAAIRMDKYLEQCAHRYVFKENANKLATIIDYQEKSGCDILAMLRHSHSKLDALVSGSSVSDVAPYLKVPLLCLVE